jgi:hypothetical protein
MSNGGGNCTPHVQFGILQWIAIIVAVFILSWTAWCVLAHQPLPALPQPLVSPPRSDVDAMGAASQSFGALVGFLTALGFGLSAVLAYALRDGLGIHNGLRATNIVFASLFILFLRADPGSLDS